VHTDTLGDLAIRCTAAGADPTDLVCQVQVTAAALASDLTAIKAKTDNLPADPAGISDLPSEPDNAGITAIKSKTDNLTFTVTNQLDANIQYVNDVQVRGAGSESDPWNPA